MSNWHVKCRTLLVGWQWLPTISDNFVRSDFYENVHGDDIGCSPRTAGE
jgi:hypothetical protein